MDVQIRNMVSNPQLSGDSHTLGRFVTLRGFSSLDCMNEYLAVDSGGYLCMDNLCALIQCG